MSDLKTFYIQPTSNQEWTKDPSLVLVFIKHETIDKISNGLEFLKQSGADFLVFQWAATWETYFELEIGEDSDDVIVHNGKRYGQRDPEYALDGCDLVLDAKGNVEVRIQFENEPDYLRASLDGIIRGLPNE